MKVDTDSRATRPLIDRTMMSRLTCFAFAALTLGACDFEGDDTEGGALGRGLFRYECVEDTDTVCDGFFDADAFPAAMAVGGRFSMSYRPDGSEPLPRLEPAASSVLAANGTVLTFLRPGTSAVLAMLDGEVFDYVQLEAQPVAEIRITDTGYDALGLAEIEIDDTEGVMLRAIPQDLHGRALGGAMEYDWSIDDPSVAQVVSLSTLRIAEIEPLAPGSTTLRVSVGGYEEVLPLVVPEPVHDGGVTE